MPPRPPLQEPNPLEALPIENREPLNPKLTSLKGPAYEQSNESRNPKTECPKSG
jgi:hypothetical protein